MKLDSSKVEFSKNDIERNVKIPSYLTNELAYYIGIHVGDGCLNMYKRKTCNTTDYNLEYSGHAIDESEFHKDYIIPPIKELFNIDPWTGIGKKTTIKTYFRSKAVFTFLSNVVGLPVGSKRDIEIPTLIKMSDLEIKKFFLKGLFDTDGCMTFKKARKQRHYYPSINLASQSKNLIEIVKIFLDYFGIPASASYDLNGVRNGKVNTKHQIDIHGRDNVDKWFKEIGFNSSKHLTKYEIWKKFGFCPPYTNIIERQKILKGIVDINSYYDPVA